MDLRDLYMEEQGFAICGRLIWREGEESIEMILSFYSGYLNGSLLPLTIYGRNMCGFSFIKKKIIAV